MRILIGIVVFHLTAMMSMAQVSFGEATKIIEGWKFAKGDFDKASQGAFDDSKWRLFDLPHDWSVEGPPSPTLASATGYLPGGIAWYRKALEIPAAQKDKKVYVYFEGVYRNAEVFINGVSLGVRPNGYISFIHELTPHLKFGGQNTIAVRVDHRQSADSRWYTGSGIYRDVYLVYANPVHLDLWGVTCTAKVVGNRQAALHVQTSVKNTTKIDASVLVIQELFDQDKKSVSIISGKGNIPAGRTTDSIQILAVKNPHLWSPDDPYLYRLTTSVFQGKQLIDKTTTAVGIRTLGFEANTGFSINGLNTKVKGVCLHHDAGCLGSAVPREVWESRLRTLKSLGCNAIRTSHNPQAPLLYDLCDELGLLVLNEAFDEWEFPKKKWLEGWNVGTPGFQGPAEFFEQWGETDLKDIVLRDRNHPSVFMWSIGNEVDYPNDPYSHPVLSREGVPQPHTAGFLPDHPRAERLGIIAKKLAAVVRKFDGSRPVTAGLAGPVMSNETEYPAALDVCGYNYSEGRYAQDHAAYPGRVLFGSENGQDFGAWKAVRDNDYIFGQFIWTGIDYLGESHAWPSRGFSSGLLGLNGLIKPRGYFRRSLWSEKPMVYLGTYIAGRNRQSLSIDAPSVWNYNQGDAVRVVCYTNCANAQLFLNGQKIGEPKSADDSTGIIYWDLPYQPGKLEAVGYRSANEAARYSIETSRRPYAIEAKLATPTTASKGVSIIALQIVDEDGKPVFLADQEITCTTEGPAKLIGLEAGNPADMGDTIDNKQRVYQGRMVAYIRSTGSGDTQVRFSSPWLTGAEILLRPVK